MSSAVQVLDTERYGVAAACAAAIAALVILESTTQAGWSFPLPSAWSLVVIVIASRVGGLAGGMWAAMMTLGYAAYTDGFTTGHASGLAVWGRASDRVLAFGLAALILVMLVHRWRPSGSHAAGLTLEAHSVSHHDAEWSSVPAWELAEDDGHRLLENIGGSERALASLCVVTRGSAHDLNNLLMAILGQCELHAAKASGTDSRDAALSAIAQAAERGSELTRALIYQCRVHGQGSHRRPSHRDLCHPAEDAPKRGLRTPRSFQ